MSEQAGGLLETKSSYHFNRTSNDNYKTNAISGNRFTSWQKDNMYKSSYAHFHSRDSVKPRSSFIPGYAGYIPGIKPQGLHAKGYTPITKQTFSNQKLATNPLGLSTNGFNVSRQAFLDQSKLGSSSKYGKSALQKAHPSWNDPQWRSTTQEMFKNPNSIPNPMYRQTGKMTQTQKNFTKSSGFATNHAYQDGTGWKPDRVLMGDNNRTEYRDRFNARVDFHRNTDTWKTRTMKPKEMNYKFN